MQSFSPSWCLFTECTCSVYFKGIRFFIHLVRKCQLRMCFNLIAGFLSIHVQVSERYPLKEVLLITGSKTHTHTPTTLLFNFWLGLLFFSVTMSWSPLCSWKQWFFRPVSQFWTHWDIKMFKIFFVFQHLSRSFLMFVCVPPRICPALALLSHGNKHSS